MSERTLVALAFTAAIGSGLVGGIFFAFSSFVMAALRSLPPEQGATAMKAINVSVINPFFMTVFLGTAVVCALVAGGSLGWGNLASGKLILVASLTYLVGCLGVTMVCNVPLNNQLASSAGAAQTAVLWHRYLEVWTAWNHVRTTACIVSALLFTAALVMI
jgi:uncharacterized membrane protein